MRVRVRMRSVIAAVTVDGRFLTAGKRRGRREHEPSRFHALDADEPVGELSHGLGGAAEQDDLEATVGVEMDVRVVVTTRSRCSCWSSVNRSPTLPAWWS